MKIGLIGLPSTGKTTFFNLLTQNKDMQKNDTAKNQMNLGRAHVPDERVDFLSNYYKPKKTTYATIDVIDIQGIIPESGSYHFLESIREVDALVHVIRLFEDESVVHYMPDIDPMRDIEAINLELLFADLSVIENRIERIHSGKKVNKDAKKELEVLLKCKDCLENEQLISTLSLDEEEKKYIKSFDFLTERPMIILLNLDEDQYVTKDHPQKNQLETFTQKQNIPLIDICAKTELEISHLDLDDRKMFMEEMKIDVSGLDLLANAMYDTLGQISFLTVGTDEVRAWPIKKGMTAKQAGGTIHSDIERGFIRAEVVKYKDFVAHGSMQSVKEKGLAKLEGKDSIIEDGDMINFRFNV